MNTRPMTRNRRREIEKSARQGVVTPVVVGGNKIYRLAFVVGGQIFATNGKFKTVTEARARGIKRYGVEPRRIAATS